MNKVVEKKQLAAGEEKVKCFSVRYDKFEDCSHGKGEGA